MSLLIELNKSLESVTKQWKKEKRQADRQDRVSASALKRMRSHIPHTSIKEAAFSVMEQAYNQASSNERYYANARQIMYAARPKIMQRADRPLSKNFDIYFTQTLLKDYIIEYGKYDWKVVWDARGHLIEPHTNTKIGLGGIEVTGYLGKWRHEAGINDPPKIAKLIDTSGPALRYNNVLFVEKEGFTEIIQTSQILDKYDVGLMSTKGLPHKASCDLIERLELKGVKVFVLRDFDYDGFKIVRTLREGVRMASGSDVVDIGLRGDDIEGLESEEVHYSSNRGNVYGYLLSDCDATREEADFLVSKRTYSGHVGRRVELNALSTEQLISLLERKLEEHGVQKMIPDDFVIEKAYKRAWYLQQIENAIKEADERVQRKVDKLQIPDQIREKVKERLEENETISWDRAVWDVCSEQESE